MERQTQYREPTLFNELSSWNAQENSFRQLFSDDVLKDRDFLKMKLAHYDKLYYKYGSSPRTTDEQAMVTMLGYQRRKMERSLYPGLLTRLLRRVASRFSLGRAISREHAMAQSRAANNYLHSLPPVQQVSGQGNEQKHRPVIRQMPVPPTLRHKNRQARQHKRGRSI